MTIRRLLLLLAASLVAPLCEQATRPATASGATVVSSNWAGFVVSGKSYRRVAGAWTVPAGNCSGGLVTSSAAWVGLGGYSETSHALEQTGTGLDCSSSGRATYSAWYELLPAPANRVSMKVRPGDKISASVEVRGTRVLLQLRNITRSTTFTKTARLSAPDRSSAEWIVEAPSECDSGGHCHQLPLGDFGTVKFTDASATSLSGHAGTIRDTAWSTTRLNLSQPGRGALTSALSAVGNAFRVTYQRGTTPAKRVAKLPALKRASP